MNANPGPAQKSEKWLFSAVVMAITAILKHLKGWVGANTSHQKSRIKHAHEIGKFCLPSLILTHAHLTRGSLMFPCLSVSITVSQRLPLRTKPQMDVP